MQLLTENHNSKKHVSEANQDAFGNKVEPEEGWRLFNHGENGDRVAKGDRYFDIYTGWHTYLDDFLVGYSGYYDGGRWTAWAKKIV